MFYARNLYIFFDYIDMFCARNLYIFYHYSIFSPPLIRDTVLYDGKFNWNGQVPLIRVKIKVDPKIFPEIVWIKIQGNLFL
jgi:hypothetical protein